jgi:nucleoside-diphosphate-sugar epimerase
MQNYGVKTILITGAAGYIGAMLADQFSKAPELERIIAIDKNPMPDLLKGNKKIFWLQAELSEGVWRDKVKIYKPEIVIHAAWQIRELYGQKALQRKLNIDATRKVFEFIFRESSVKKLIYFSTIASFGAFSENKLDFRFTEESSLCENEYLYGIEKKEVEDILQGFYKNSRESKQVFVLKLTSVTGPRGRYDAGKKGLLYMLQNVLPFLPVAREDWCRQYVHEDDLTDAVAILVFNDVSKEKIYDTLVIAPNDYVLAKDMAEVFKKRILHVPIFCVRLAFFLAWHLTRGRIPTGYGAWKFFCYPIPVKGNKITEKYGFEYLFSSIEALSKNDGRYQRL